MRCRESKYWTTRSNRSFTGSRQVGLPFCTRTGQRLVSSGGTVVDAVSGRGRQRSSVSLKRAELLRQLSSTLPRQLFDSATSADSRPISGFVFVSTCDCGTAMLSVVDWAATRCTSGRCMRSPPVFPVPVRAVTLDVATAADRSADSRTVLVVSTASACSKFTRLPPPCVSRRLQRHDKLLTLLRLRKS